MSNKVHENDLADIAEQLMEYVQKGMSLADIENISDEAMEEMYACAYFFYQENKLDEAENLFKMLCLYDLNNADYVIGLGAVNQIRKDYNKACNFYALAYVMADENYLPMLYGGQCQLLMGNFGKALQCFSTVVKKCSDEKITSRAKIYIDIINKNRADKES